VNAADIQRALGLKHTDREGWKRAGVAPVESVAAHSWGMALLALVRCPPELNRDQVLALCILHDLPEVITGDITPHDGVGRPKKLRLERAAAEDLLRDRPDLLALVEDYASQRTPEARYVRQLDKLDMGLQARAYASERSADTREFVVSASDGIVDPALRELLRDRPDDC
jgi:putative hydrolases of HD superfamily